MRRRTFLVRSAGLAGSVVFGGCVGFTTDSRAPLDQLQPGTWSVHRPMPSARQEVAVAAVGDRVVVVGGFGDLGAPVSTVEAYHPATDAWEPLPPLPEPRHHAAAAVLDGRLFVVGGFSDRMPRWTAEASVYEYDATRNAWTMRPPLLTARGGHAAAVAGGRLHVVGGTDGDPLGAHEVYDPTADRWSARAPMPTARDHLAAVGLQGGMWAIGGRSSFLGTQHARVEIYDPAADTWTAGPPLADGRGGLAAAALGDRIFVFGGEAPFRIFSATDMYEGAGHRWIGKTPMPTPRHGIGAAVVDGQIWIPGGATRPGLARTTANEAYRP